MSPEIRIGKGRHVRPRRSGNARLRAAIGTLAGAGAVVAAITLILSSSPSQAARTPSNSQPAVTRVVPQTGSIQVTNAEREELHQYMTVPRHRTQLSSLVAHSFKQAGITTGTSGVEVPNHTSLDLAYGITGQHVWAIVSFADVYDGAVAAFTAGCAGLMIRNGLGRLSWLCAWMGEEIDKWSAGRAWAANHGVWVAVYWWPWIYYQWGFW
jgi:hypothetical protein